MADMQFAREQLLTMYRFIELSQTKRTEARKWCLGALSALPISIILKFGEQDLSLKLFSEQSFILLVAIFALGITVLFWLYELILSTQQGLVDKKTWELEKYISEIAHIDRYPKNLLYRSGKESDEKEHYEKIKKFGGAVFSEEILAFYSSIDIVILVCILYFYFSYVVESFSLFLLLLILLLFLPLLFLVMRLVSLVWKLVVATRNHNSLAPQ
jgi:hypothetical protein